MKRLKYTALLLVMVMIMSVPVFAAEPQYTLTLLADGSSAASVKAGDEVTVTLQLSENGSENFDLYSMQDYVCFDPDILSFVDDSIEVYTVVNGEQKRPVMTASPLKFYATGTGDINRIFINRASGTAEPVESPVTLLTFKLKALKAGTSSVTHDTVEVFQNAGSLYQVTKQEAKITVNSTQTNTRPSSGGSSSNTSQKDVSSSSTDTPAVSTVTNQTTANVDSSASGTTAKVTITDTVAAEIIKQAEQNKSDSVVIKSDVQSDITKIEVNIPASAVSDIGSNTQANLNIVTSMAEVSISNNGLSGLAAGGSDVTVTTEKTGDTVSLTVSSGGEKVKNIDGGVTLNVPVESSAPGVVAILINEDGTEEVIRKSLAQDGSISIPLDGSASVKIVDNSKSFTDVPSTSWASDAVAFASGHELFQGTSETTFAPDASMTRGMLAQVLHNLENNPSGDVLSFNDVSDDAWYSDAVSWAASSGIVEGYGDDKFAPNNDITREQLAVMLWRYAGKPAAAGQKASFNDLNQVSSYAKEAIAWATSNGILNGKGESILDPKGDATRAQVAQMLKNFIAVQ
jgi:hypothetical protein